MVLAEESQRIGNHERGSGYGRRIRDECQGRATRERVSGKLVPVGTRPAQRHEQVSGSRGAAVGGDAGDHGRQRRAGRHDSPRAGGRNDLRDGEPHTHDGPAPLAAVRGVWSACRTTCRSSNGCFVPMMS